MSKNILNDEIQRIYDRDGEVKASVVVEDSRPKTAPLHSRFEWRDKIAAEEYRINQARHLIKVAVIRDSEDEPRKLIHVPIIRDDESSSNEGKYQLAEVVVKSQSAYERCLDSVLAHIRGCEEDLRELERVAEGNDRMSMLAALMQSLSTSGELAKAMRAEH